MVRPFNSLLPLALLCLAMCVRADDPPANPPVPLPPRKVPVRPWQVERLIQMHVDAIYSALNKNGHWDEKETDPTGEDREFAGSTALALYALLAAGESPENPKLKPALNWLKNASVNGTYVVGIRLNAYNYLPHQAVKTLAKSDQNFLFKAQTSAIDPKTKTANPAAGLYDYMGTPDVNRIDHSVSQYAVLGMWAAEQIGLSVPETYWRSVESAWIRDQRDDGGWNYGSPQDGPSTGSMTAAGVTTLFVTQDYLRSHMGAPGKGNITNTQVERGMNWLGEKFSAANNPDGDAAYRLYWLYGVERVGLASGYKYFGEHDWFDEGVRAVAENFGRFPGFNRVAGDKLDLGHEVRELSFGLLFLARGQKPFLMNKLKYDGDWNERPRDVAKLTRWYAPQYETELLWQIVDIDNDATEFHDAPVLFMSGFSAPKLTAEQKQKLKQFMEDGGLLVGNADGQSQAFIDSFSALVSELLPQYKLRPVPADHILNTGYTHLNKPIAVMSMSNGIRDLCMLLAEQDPPRAWTGQRYQDNPDLFEIAANIAFYGSDKGRLRTRGDVYIERPDPLLNATRKATLVRIEHAGAWNPEPGGWRRMVGLLHNQNLLDLEVEALKLGEGKLPGKNFAHLTGMEPLELSTAQLGELRTFIARGGTLIVDAAGGNPKFAESMEKQLVELINGASFESIAVDDPIFSDTHPLDPPAARIFPEQAAEEKQAKADAPNKPLVVEYRRYAKNRMRNTTGLQLKGLKLGRRWAVILSPFDLSAGLVGQNVDGIIGYSPATATEIVRRIIVNTTPKANPQ